MNKSFLLMFLCFAKISGLDDIKYHSIALINEYIDSALDANTSKKCGDQMKFLSRDLHHRKPWALKMIDAISKPGSGILAGNVRDVGSYDECVSISSEDSVQGKYCLTVIKPAARFEQKLKILKSVGDFVEVVGVKFNRKNITDIDDTIPLTYGMCVPAACSVNDLQIIMNHTETKFDSRMHMKFVDQLCATKDSYKFTRKAVIAIIIFISIGLLVTSSTAYDVFIYQKSKEESNRIWTVFSFYTNGKSLFSSKSPEGNLGCINGIRVISITWVILGHTFMLNVFFPNINGLYIFEWSYDLRNVFVLGAPLSVDTFFALSGLLLVYVYLNVTVNKGIEVPFKTFYMHRFLRLTPALAGVVLFYHSLLNSIGDGPYWFSVKTLYEENCNNYWWSTLLYIQNYHNSLNECVNHTWYLAVDTQLYMISPLILVQMRKYPKRTLMTVGLVFVASSLAAYIITVVHEVGAVPVDAGTNYFKYIYHPTHIRMTPWLVGVAWGYALFKCKDHEITLSTAMAVVIWCLVLFIMIMIMCAHVLLAHYDFNPHSAALFNALARPTWAFGVCWVIFACVKGYGGIINRFLSMNLFAVMAKLTYAMYLLHFAVIIFMVSKRRQAGYFSNLTSSFEFWGNYSVTVILSILWTLTFESPVVALEKILLQKASTTGAKAKLENLRSNLSAREVKLDIRSDAKYID